MKIRLAKYLWVNLYFVVKIVAHEDCLDWYLRFKLDPEDPVKCHVDGDKRKGGKTPSFAYGSTGCHQGWQELRNYQKFASLTVTCEDAKAYMYSLSSKRRVHKWTDIQVNLYI